MKKVLVLGGTGFVGRHVCELLNRLGVRVTVPTRRLSNGSNIQMLPMVELVQADVHDEATLARLLPGHDAVVNLIAVLHGNARRFEQMHVTLPRKLAATMQATGVKRLVHISALGASEAGPSHYQASKARGEQVLRDAGLQLTVLRPSVIFGAEDKFLNTFARVLAYAPMLPLPGAATRFQPVWVGDVAAAAVHALTHPDTTNGQTIECVGPQVFTLLEMVDMVNRLSGHHRLVFGVPIALGYFQAAFLQMAPGEPVMSTDNLRSMEVDNVASGSLPTQANWGIEAQAMGPLAASYVQTQGAADPLLAIRRHAK